MDMRRVSDEYSVSGQLTVDDVPEIAAAGFRSIICNRPDNEGADQTGQASIKAAAEKAGLAFRYVPVLSSGMTPDDVEAMRQALDSVPGPVFAYCRSGTRSTNIYNAVKAQRG